MTAKCKTPQDLWAIHDLLTQRRSEIDEKYDFRYSSLRVVFARLLNEGWLKLDDLAGLSNDRLTDIQRCAEQLKELRQ